MSQKNKIKTPQTPEEVIRNKKKSILGKREITSFFTRLIGLALFIYIVFFVIYKLVPAPNDDMRPTIRARDLQVVYTLDHDYKLSDLVYYQADGQYRSGRVVGVPGDTIEITEDNKLKVNGGITTFDNVYYETPAYDSDVTYPYILGSNEYFILSDYREGAEDSRQFGAVTKDNIKGKIIFVIRRNSL